MISKNKKISYCKSCVPASGYKKKWYKITDPDMQAWFEENRISYEKIPPHNPECEIIFKGAAPVITSPVNGTEYLINKKNPEPLQLTCKTANDVSKIYWYINNKFYKRCKFHYMFRVLVHNISANTNIMAIPQHFKKSYIIECHHY